MSFEIAENITQADIAFRITGADLNELFISAATAVLSVMIEDSSVISGKLKKKIKLKNPETDLLLFDFLQEIIFLKDAESLLLLPESMNCRFHNNGYKLDCILRGEKIDTARHRMLTDIKAVTLHRLSVEKATNGWSGYFVLDV